MYTLLRQRSLRSALWGEAPAFLLSLLVAELFFHFHSFTLECGAFCVVWFGLGWAADGVRRVMVGSRQQG